MVDWHRFDPAEWDIEYDLDKLAMHQLPDDEIDALVIAEADDPSAWGDPIIVPPSKSPRPAWMAQSKHVNFTALQGRYLAFIHIYTRIHGRPPAEADLQRFFRTTPPAIHQMVITLDRNGLISRIPGAPRSIRVLVPESELPLLDLLRSDLAAV